MKIHFYFLCCDLLFLPEFYLCKTLIIVLVNFTMKVTDSLKFSLIIFLSLGYTDGRYLKFCIYSLTTEAC
jgi:hypothetical protein